MHYEGKLRVRACGILIENDQILLVRHIGVDHKPHFWSPPGGGISFGESSQDAVVREFFEETNLKIRVKNYLFSNEYIGDKIHAIEIFFEVERISGEANLGHDPELTPENQILDKVAWYSISELIDLDNQKKHNILHRISSFQDLISKNGFFEFQGNSSK
ncbi:MAG: NUDIX hydrolase [Cyclobacteriaceae bacterium]